MTRRPAVWLVASMAVYAGAVAAQAPPSLSNTAVVVEYDGIIHPVSAEFFNDALDYADQGGAPLFVLVLRTPGGLLESTRTMVSRMIAAKTPVAVLVAPSGSRAASAGFIITLAADIAAMAPGTHIGAAHPVPAGGGQQEGGDTTMSEKAASDTAAYARTLAAARKRNVELAAEAVLDSRAFTDQEALTAKPPLIDLVADDLPDLLRQLDGRTIARFDGSEVTLDTDQLAIERLEMTRRQRLLAAIAHPQIAALLLSLGMLGLVVELWNPGAIFPGVIGGISLLLAFFAFQVLPVNIAGILLIVLGAGLLVAEAIVPSFGVLGIGGLVSLVAGAVMITTEVPGVSVNYQMLIPIAIAFGALVVLLGRLGIAAQRQKSVTGAEGLVGSEGDVLSPIVADRAGQIHLHGEIWRAVSSTPIAAATRVRVVAVEGLTVRVEPIARTTPQGDSV